MLNPECQNVYDILCEIAGVGEGFKIVDADEITQKLPSSAELTKIQLSQIIRELKERDLVNIKYFTPDEYCLCVVKRLEEPPKPALEEDEQDRNTPAPVVKERVPYGEKKRSKTEQVRRGAVLFMSFLGGLLGSAIVAAVTVILTRFVF